METKFQIKFSSALDAHVERPCSADSTKYPI